MRRCVSFEPHCDSLRARRWAGALGLCAVLSGLVSCDDAPALTGDGRLRTASIASRQGVNESVATPDGASVVFYTTGPRPQIVLADHDMQAVRARDASVEALAVSSDEILTYGWGVFKRWPLKELEVSETVSIEGDFGIGVPLLCGWKDGWLCVNGSSGDMWHIRTSPLTARRVGTVGTETIRAIAADETTGVVVTVSDGGHVTMWLAGTVERVGLCKLDYREARSICARNGVAWVGTEDGRVIGIDLKTNAVGGTVTIGGAQSSTLVTLSPSGRHAAACTSERDASGAWRIHLRTFEVTGKRLVAKARAEAVFARSVNAITLLDDGVVIISTPVYVGRWSSRDKG